MRLWRLRLTPEHFYNGKDVIATLRAQCHLVWILLKGIVALGYPSLIETVQRSERFYRLKNVAAVANEYWWPRRFLNAATRHPATSLAVVVLVYSMGVWVAVGVDAKKFGLQPPADIGDYYRDFLNINVGILA